MNPEHRAPAFVEVIDVVTRGADQTRAVARRLASRLNGGDVIALDGPLGAGKTCFVRGLAEGLGLDPRSVASPTFVLCREYGDPAEGKILLHLDAYRLGGPEELETIGWHEMQREENAIIAVEWAERLEAELPADHVHVEISHVTSEERSLRITAPANMARRLSEAEAKHEAGEGSPGLCPICGKASPRDNDAFPFCGARCRLVDLGRWLGESYRIQRPVEQDDEW